MALSDAERQRRHRSHKAGNHENCEDESVCLGLGERGQRLYRELKPREWDPAYRVMAEELCRLADRTERLDSFLRGEPEIWLHIRHEAEGSATITVVVDQVLDAARSNIMAYKQVLTELRQGMKLSRQRQVTETTSADSKAAVPGEVFGANITSLTSYIERARQEASGD